MTTFPEIDLKTALALYAQQNMIDLSMEDCWALPSGNRSGYNSINQVTWFHGTVAKPTEMQLITLYDAFIVESNTAATETQTLLGAQNVALNQAKSYLRKQLLNANPDMSVIFPIVKSYVDANAALLQMVNNQIDLNRSAFTWPALNLVTPAAVDRTRYLRSVEDVISLIG